MIGPPSASATLAVVVSGTLRDWYVVPRTSGGITISGTVFTAVNEMEAVLEPPMSDALSVTTYAPSSSGVNVGVGYVEDGANAVAATDAPFRVAVHWNERL